MYLEEIGKNIKLCRVLKDLKQEELAAMAGISAGYLSLLERGKRVPSLSRLEKLATSLGISLPIFFFLGADGEGLEKVDPDLAQRLVATAFKIVKG